VTGGGVGIAIGFEEEEAGRIVQLLEAIEAGDAWFASALPGVGDGGLLERLDTIRFDVDEDVNNEHEGKDAWKERTREHFFGDQRGRRR